MNVGLHSGVPNSVVGTTMPALDRACTRQQQERSMTGGLGWPRSLKEAYSNLLAYQYSANRSAARRETMRSLHTVS